MKPKENKVTMKSWMIITVGIVLILFIGSWTWVTCQLSSWSDRGAFGDMFGGVNALFAGLAFGGVIIAIVLQMELLKLQREELEQTRKELTGQKEQMQRQADYIAEQNFESKFFQLIKLHSDNINRIKARATSEHSARSIIAEGVDAFRPIFMILDSSLQANSERYNKNELIQSVFGELYVQYRALSSYYKTLYNLMMFVDKSNIADKNLYISVIKAQFSTFELGLLFYYSLWNHGKSFYPQVVKYQLLEHLDLDLIQKKKHLGLYPRETYGDRDGDKTLDKIERFGNGDHPFYPRDTDT
jgi:uncharacterized protein (UPF0305 family)